MITKPLLTEVLEMALSTGADYAEVYVEHTKENNITMIDSKVDSVTDKLISGVGMRIFLGTRCVTASCTSLEREDLLACARRMADALDFVTQKRNLRLVESLFGYTNPVRNV
ncbi:MAG: TldD/PmbA family protein, partial [Lachnospiraceae bacterium]|nr:TldD/PmbA family protein [Lachnospiraceae bacterium]